jgi:hypothetical protein
MCVSAAPASFSETVLYAGRLHHPVHGHTEVLGYQNTAVNQADGPNAMLLHLPAIGLTRDNLIPVGDDGDFLSRMLEAVRPAAAGRSRSLPVMQAASVQVFEHDVYTVVLAEDPRLIPAALSRVPSHRRPSIADELFGFYADRFPQHTVALCCFDNADAQRAKPLVFRYPVPDPEVIVLPTVDAHTGGAPELGALVPVDHWLIFGSDEAPDGWGTPVTHPPADDDLAAYRPDRVTGFPLTGRMPNGDTAIAVSDLHEGRLDKAYRV